MNRRFPVVAAFAIWAQCSAVFAQVSIPERADEHTVVALKVDRTFPTGSKVKYRWAAPTLSIGEGTADNKTAYATGAPGSHPGSLTVAWVENDALQLERHDWTLVIGDAPPTPPVVVKTLAELAGKDAATFAEIVTDGRSGLAKFTTVAKFHEYLALAYDFAKIPADHPAALEIKSRIDAAASGTLTDASRKSLDVALAKVVTDLGAKPPVPPVTEGKRLVVIVADLKDTTPERAAMFNNLRTGTEAQYLSSKGHQLLILDEAQETTDGTPDPFVAKLKAMGEALPAEFVLDLQTKAVIAKQALPSTSAAVVDFVKGNGG